MSDIDEMAAEIVRLRKEREWRDISTAPKDGTRVMLWMVPTYDGGTISLIDDDPHPVFGSWVKWADNDKESGFREGWTWYGSARCKPTHWMPLPPPPEKEKT